MSLNYDPDHVIPPGDTIREVMEVDGIAEKTMRKMLKITDEEFERLLDGELPLTSAIAAHLETATNVPCRIWQSLEHNYRVGLAAGKKKG